MSGVYAITTEGEEALGAATAETVLQLQGATTTYAKIVRWGISFDGIASTDAPVVVRLLRQTTAGTSTGCTEVALDAQNAITAACAGFRHFTAEPTASSVLETYEVHPQGGSITIEYPNDDSAPTLANATTSRLAIEATAPAAVNCVAFMHWRE